MHLRVVTYVRITQRSTDLFPTRSSILNFNFVNSWEASDSWRDLTNKGKLVIPKSLYYKDGSGKMQPLKGENINIGGDGTNSVPLFLRGDKVFIQSGYKYYDVRGNEINDAANIYYDGYISKVHSKIPITLDLEDNMWLLKQTPVDTHTFADSDTLENILANLISSVNRTHGVSFTYRAMTSTTFGGFLMMGNQSVAQVLHWLTKTFGFEFYFKGDELRGGTIIYKEDEAQTVNFTFQRNIISDELEYMRLDDVVLSAVAHNTVEENTGAFTKDGTEKTKNVRLEVLVTIKNGRRSDIVIQQGDIVPEAQEGERRTFFFPGAATTQQLADLAYDKLKMYYYQGFRGTFTTFGIPFVRQGDNALLRDPVLPERAGLYKIKAVDYTGGVGGIRQIVHIDFKINVAV